MGGSERRGGGGGLAGALLGGVRGLSLPRCPCCCTGGLGLGGRCGVSGCRGGGPCG